MKKVIVGLFVLLSYILFIGFFFTNKLMYIKKKTNEEILRRDSELGLFHQADFDSLVKVPFSIPSPFGYVIKGTVIEPYETKRYVIFCHGVTVNHLNSVKYMNLFLEKGWNVLIYDHRRHGESGGKTTSYGHYEKHDLQSVVQWLKKRTGHSVVLGIHGESMGAVTTLLYAGMVEDAADFYIVDCPFSELEEQLKYRLKAEFKLPGFLVLPIAKPFLRIRDKYSLADVSPLHVISNIHNPVLFIHSRDDDYIPVEMTKQLYEKKQGFKKLFIAQKGAHAMSYAENRAEYSAAVDEFLEELGFPTQHT